MKAQEEQSKEGEEENDACTKEFDLKVSFLLVREHERVDLIIEYFNEKLKKMNKQQMESNDFPRSEENNLENKPLIHDSISQFEASSDGENFNIQLQAQELEKEFVFNFRTFKEVFPYISSV